MGALKEGGLGTLGDFVLGSIVLFPGDLGRDFGRLEGVLVSWAIRVLYYSYFYGHDFFYLGGFWVGGGLYLCSSVYGYLGGVWGGGRGGIVCNVVTC